ncbi:hypothetical protein EMCG_02431 [[Emmonsia] crescens]|uniref:Uncharacterized protein n=1 Tax=[Emmonsia] crescens TaxID=73230 RepID=A0A0G2J922_9EURO|nr:hypothetical protein EMCG_02431 [Emmonsia crescens UAMH 3008]
MDLKAPMTTPMKVLPVKMKWDNATEAKLLKQIIKNAKLGKKDHEELAEFMGCTPRAIKEHISAMQKGAPNEETGSSGPSTPVKSAKSTPKKQTPASAAVGGKKRKSTMCDDENDHQVDDSPVKKVKAEISNWAEVKKLNGLGGDCV